MQQLYDVIFASSNTHKYEEANKILAEFGIRLGFFQTELVEIQDDAQFVAIIAFCDSSNEPILFESSVTGTISKNIQDGGWGYDPIFIPEKQNKTYAELADKNKLSHRYESLKKFANWFNNKRE